MSKTILKQCQQCNNDFQASLREHNRGNAKFCSKDCLYASKRGVVKEKEDNAVCSTCKETFYRSPSKLTKSKSGHYFCSRICKEEAQKFDNPDRIESIMPSHFFVDSPDKYRKKYLNRIEEIKCERCGYDEVPEILQVHHKDRNRKNSDMSNLELLCPNCHLADHYKMKDGLFSNRRGLIRT